ncbi:DNA alkylation repair enzyme [Candidatus Norongarragalina meridionalis]|nr:DNA alkylation repair enzyme [Candidatus Norongarragalina meridionalis]
MEYNEIIRELRAEANPKNVEGMSRFGINPKNTLGVCVPKIRALAKKIGKNHGLAPKLWASGIHEARLLATMIEEPAKVTEAQMERWAKDFDSWGVCDQACMNLFDKTPYAWKKAVAWTSRREEFVKRAGFALMASLAVHDKKAEDGKFLKLLPLIVRESDDNRNFVKKAANWALRQIGKRNGRLRKEAVKTAKLILRKDSPSARWIASDALRELT